MFPVFQKLRALSYVEYFLVGCGAAYSASSQSQIPKWLGPGALAVESTARIVTCEKQRGGESIEQDLDDTGHVVLCGTCRDIQSRFVTAMPRRVKARRTKQDDLLGGDDASADESGVEASTVSSDAGQQSGSGSEAEAEREEKKATSQLSASTTLAKIRPARQGMPASLWLQIFNVMQPKKIVLAGTVTFQAGLLYAILQYNDKLFGVLQCPLVGFCAQEPPRPTEQDWTQKHVKQWQARHLCLHSIERSLNAYAGRRYTAMAANRKAALGGGKRVLRREGTDCSLGGGPPEPPQVTVTKFIMPHGNHGKEAKMLPRPPAGQPDPDSDDPEGDAPSTDGGEQALSKRNARFLAKHGVKVSASSDASGMGLFSVGDIPADTELPAKGPWFNSLEEVHTFLAGLHADTAATFSKCVVRVDLAPVATEQPPAASQGQEPPAASQGQEPRPTSLYKVITNPVRFINHFTAIQTTPNCKLILKEGMPLGEHCLVVKSTRAIRKDKQWLLNYGPHHQCGERTVRKRKGAGGAGGKGKIQKGDTPSGSPAGAQLGNDT